MGCAASKPPPAPAPAPNKVSDEEMAKIRAALNAAPKEHVEKESFKRKMNGFKAGGTGGHKIDRRGSAQMMVRQSEVERINQHVKKKRPRTSQCDRSDSMSSEDLLLDLEDFIAIQGDPIEEKRAKRTEARQGQHNTRAPLRLPTDKKAKDRLRWLQQRMSRPPLRGRHQHHRSATKQTTTSTQVPAAKAATVKRTLARMPPGG